MAVKQAATDRRLALMISFPGGSGKILRTFSQSCINQGSTTASGLQRKSGLNNLHLHLHFTKLVKSIWISYSLYTYYTLTQKETANEILSQALVCLSI